MCLQIKHKPQLGNVCGNFQANTSLYSILTFSLNAINHFYRFSPTLYQMQTKSTGKTKYKNFYLWLKKRTWSLPEIFARPQITGYRIIKIYLFIISSHSVMSDSFRPHGLYSPWNSPGPNTAVGSLSLLQQIFPTQELNRGLLHCRWILYQLSYEETETKKFHCTNSICDKKNPKKII